MITIESNSGWFKAVLDDTEDGVAVAVWRRSSGGLWSPIHRETIDCPWHVVCDRVHELVNRLRREVVLPSGKKILAG